MLSDGALLLRQGNGSIQRRHPARELKTCGFQMVCGCMPRRCCVCQPPAARPHDWPLTDLRACACADSLRNRHRSRHRSRPPQLQSPPRSRSRSLATQLNCNSGQCACMCCTAPPVHVAHSAVFAYTTPHLRVAALHFRACVRSPARATAIATLRLRLVMLGP